MIKILLFTMITVVMGCGKDTYPLLLKVEQLRESKLASLQDFVSIHEHVELLEEMLKIEIPKNVKLPSDIICADFVLSQVEIEEIKLQCESSYFDICPLGFSNYSTKALALVRRCKDLKD